MKTTEPYVSIVVPVYNRETMLRECLNSIAGQTFEEWECLVVDDESTDRSRQVASEYQSCDPRFKALRRPASVAGAAACRNFGLRESRGRYIVFLDSDDLLHPNCLASRVEFVAGRDGALDFAVFPTLIFRQRPGDADILWNIDKPVADLVRFLRLDVPWSIVGPIWRAAALRSIGGFDESLPGWQDWQVHVLALLEGLRFERSFSPPDCYVRAHAGLKISSLADQVSHVEAKTRYLLALMEKYRGRLLVDRSLRDAVAGLMWFQVTQLERAGRLRVGLRFWWCAWRLKFIDSRIFRDGACALILHGKPGGSFAWTAVRYWPDSIVRSVDTSTCHAVRSVPALARPQVGAAS
jgi:glycosyltransferase involved in cell wall biosynthesis